MSTTTEDVVDIRHFFSFIGGCNTVRDITGMPYCKIPVATEAYVPRGTLGSAMLFFSSKFCR